MLKGYAVNQKRLEYLEKTIKLIDIANRIDERLEGTDAKEILKVIGEYSKALDILDDYDHRTLKKIEGNIDGKKYEGIDASILDKIHRKKIDISDAIYVVNIDGYIGNSTKNEIEYAKNSGKEIIYHEKLN